MSSHLEKGLVPPRDRAVLQVLGTKEIVKGEKFRLAVTDGTDKYKNGLIVLNKEEEEEQTLPDKDDVVDFGDADNKMIEAGGRHVWVVTKFNILRGAAASTAPSTPSSSSSAGASAVPRTPIKRHAVDGDPNRTPTTSKPEAGTSSGQNGARSTPWSVKRSLFDGSRAGPPSQPSTSNGVGRGSVPPSQATHDIKSLNPYQNKYTIRARCVNLGELNERSTSRWSGHVFSVVLQDNSGDIRATGFGDVAKKFHPMFREGGVFYVSNAQIKPIQNRAFNHTKHDYELNLNQNTVVVECKRQANDLPMAFYDFVKIAEVDTKQEGDTIDVVGVCTAVEDIKEVGELTK